MFSAPAGEGLKAAGWSKEKKAEADLDNLLKSALDSVES